MNNHKYTVAYQMALCFLLGARYMDHPHAPTFSPQLGKQAFDQVDYVKPVRLGAARVACHRDARRSSRRAGLSAETV